MTDFETKDSGERAQFSSGMQRDTQDGKPRYDLLPRYMMRRMAELLARGAEKYTANNWRLAAGAEELERFKASAARHFFQWLDGDRTEDHAAAAMWNIAAYEEVLSETAGATALIYDFRDPRLPERFWSKIDIDDRGCWVWTAATFQTGYGAIRFRGDTRTAHSVAWEAYNGAVPAGLELDHLCRNRLCCSPYHLEAVTHEENVRRGAACGNGFCRQGHPKPIGERCLTCSRVSSGWTGGSTPADRTECPQGHPYDGTNTWVEPSTGRRRCKLCKRETQRRYRARLSNDEHGNDVGVLNRGSTERYWKLDGALYKCDAPHDHSYDGCNDPDLACKFDAYGNDVGVLRRD